MIRAWMILPLTKINSTSDLSYQCEHSFDLVYSEKIVTGYLAL